MKTVTFSIKGTSPLMFHKFSVEVLSKSKPKSGSTGNDPEEWKTTVWNDGKRLYLPGFYFFSCLKEGGKYIKIGRGTISNKLISCMRVKSEKCFLNRELPNDLEKIEEMTVDPAQPIYLDVRGVKNPATKGRNVRYRLALKSGWECTAEIEFDDTVISKDDMKRCIEAAGKFSGLGDGRSIGYGRFEILDVGFV